MPHGAWLLCTAADIWEVLWPSSSGLCMYSCLAILQQALWFKPKFCIRVSRICWFIFLKCPNRSILDVFCSASASWRRSMLNHLSKFFWARTTPFTVLRQTNCATWPNFLLTYCSQMQFRGVWVFKVNRTCRSGPLIGMSQILPRLHLYLCLACRVLQP